TDLRIELGRERLELTFVALLEALDLLVDAFLAAIGHRLTGLLGVAAELSQRLRRGLRGLRHRVVCRVAHLRRAGLRLRRGLGHAACRALSLLLEALAGLPG